MPSRLVTYSVSLLISVLFLLNLTACATLNESECKTANWEIIGMEDGSQGRPTSYIGEHRQACADYQITPDLDMYLKGHAAGIRQFCTEQNGFQQAIKGQANKNLCPSDLAASFNSGYKRGMEVFAVAAQVRKMRDDIYRHKQRLDEIDQLTKNMEEELVDQYTGEHRRRALIKDIKELEREAEAINIELDEMYHVLERLENRHENLLNRG